MIRLIINADDFGYSPVFNRKILELLGKGFIKSTTVMVKRISGGQDGQIRRLEKLRSTRGISVGLHLELDTKRPMKRQISKQYQRFISIFGSEPSHMDIHKIVDDKRAIHHVNMFAERHGLPVRNHGIRTKARHTTYPAFACRGWVMDIDETADFIRKVKDGSSCELIVHPGKYDPASKSSLNMEREKDYDAVVKLQGFLKSHKNIRNISYLEL